MMMMIATDGRRKLLRPLTYRASSPHWKLQPLTGDYGSSSRWNPTAEQVEALEEMYRRGTRSPSAQQIQQIAANLTKFGKIEAKNVFYWFQNHKARHTHTHNKSSRQHTPTYLSDLSNRSRLGINCITASKCGESAVDKELEQKYYYNADVKGRGPENAYRFWKMLGTKKDNLIDLGTGSDKENKTLELFPIKSGNDLSSVEDGGSSRRFVPNQFFEFLPTKN